MEPSPGEPVCVGVTVGYVVGIVVGIVVGVSVGITVGVVVGPGESMFSEFATLRRPPDETLPDSAETLSTPFTSADLISDADAPGFTDFSNAAAPATTGVAMEVPESYLYPPFR